ncbi:MAG: peptidoglycan recognition family protein [Candidatus Brocadia sp.]
MRFKKKIYICLSFFAIMYLSGCYTPPTFKPITTTTVKPPKKEIPYINGQLDRYFVRDWKYIVIHHSASASGCASEFDRFHREKRGWENGLGYHFVIGNGNGSGDGKIEIGSRWINQIDGAHAGVQEYNHYGIGICLVGNFNESYPTAAQMASLSALVSYLQERCHIPSENIIMHRHFRETDCPGRNFPYYKLLAKTTRW